MASYKYLVEKMKFTKLLSPIIDLEYSIPAGDLTNTIQVY
jgi:hypothetical protein